MGILLSGDLHLNKYNRLHDITRDSIKRRYGEYYDEIKYHIMLGDTGFLQPGKRSADHKFFETLSKRPFPILCVFGDDDPVYGRDDIPEIDIGIGETVYKISDKPFIAYLKRGKIYNLDGMKCLVLGGAKSIDIEKRKREKRWWKNEYWSEQEKKELFKLLENENKFDIVLSHTGPDFANKFLIENHHKEYKLKNDEVSVLNEDIYNLISFRLWLCGHWHYDENFYDEDMKSKIVYLHQNTEYIEKKDSELTERLSNLLYTKFKSFTG